MLIAIWTASSRANLAYWLLFCEIMLADKIARLLFMVSVRVAVAV